MTREVKPLVFKILERNAQVKTATKTAASRSLRIITLICYMALAVMFMSAARAQSQYSPDINTLLEVHEAANFTDAFVVPCGLDIEAKYYNLCLDPSNTGWDANQLMRWADHGLGHWDIVAPWTRLSQEYLSYSTMLVNFPRNEGLYIAVSEYFIMYRVIRLELP